GRRSCKNVRCKNMKPSNRIALVESHIPAIAVAILLFWSLDSAVRALGALWLPMTDYLATAVATLSFRDSYYFTDQMSALVTLAYALEAIAELAAAWLLARWAFGLGPLRVLIGYGARVPLR